MSIVGFNSLAIALQREESRRRMQALALIAAWIGIVLGFAVLLAVTGAVKSSWNSVAILLGACVISGIVGLLSMSNLHRQIVMKSAGLKDPKLVRNFLEVLDAEDPRVRQMARIALRNLLPAVNSANQPPYSAAQIQRLCGLLADQDFVLAMGAMRALRFVGDQNSIVELEKFSQTAQGVKHETDISEAVSEIRIRLTKSAISSLNAEPTNIKLNVN